MEAFARNAFLTVDEVRDDPIRKSNSTEFNQNSGNKQQAVDRQAAADLSVDVICFIVLLRCNLGSLTDQRVLLANFMAAALRAAPAIASAGNGCLATEQVAIWALPTYPPNFLAILWWRQGQDWQHGPIAIVELDHSG